MLTLVLVPALFPALADGKAANDPVGTVLVQATETAEVATAGPAPDPQSEIDLYDAAARAAATSTTTTVAKPTTTTTAPKPKATTTTAPKPKATTTTAPKLPPEVPAVGNTQTGRATYYDQEQGVCAHRSLPLGTEVTVTAAGSGAAVTCTVGDRGPFVQGYVIDLSPADFEQLAPLSAGRVTVTVSW